MGDGKAGLFRLAFSRQLRVESRGATVTSDAGLLLPRELDERLSPSALIERHLTDPRPGRNRQFPANDVQEQAIEDPAARPRGRPSHASLVRYRSVQHQAVSWDRPRRVIAKGEHHLGELVPRGGCIIPTSTGTTRAFVRLATPRGTAEQWITEGNAAPYWTRLSCHRFRANAVRLLLGVIAYHLGKCLRRLGVPPAIQCWSLTSLQQRFFKTGGRLIRHARYFVPQLADSHLTRTLFGHILGRIERLAWHPS